MVEEAEGLMDMAATLPPPETAYARTLGSGPLDSTGP